jgi:hypothetical protein
MMKGRAWNVISENGIIMHAPYAFSKVELLILCKKTNLAAKISTKVVPSENSEIVF